MMRRCATGLRLSVAIVSLFAAAPPRARGAEPVEAEISPAARLAAATMRVGEGFRAIAVASEPLLSNPVAFCFDPAGRIYVAETHRIKHGTEDNRDHMDWLDDDLAARTVDDRRAYIARHLGARIGLYAEASELVRRIEDRDGDGVYDASQVFADGFNDVTAGAAAGVLSIGDRLLFACIPQLWELRDANGDGVADERRVLADGFGVHTSLFGHDLHGLTLGPDGRVYFSIGDRGFHVKTPGGELSNPDSGAVLSCRPDGSDLRVFATGLRNPQELAFNEWGDLFTVDNNSDYGDRARVVHLVEGMDAGWRMSYQYLPDRGPFVRERVWETANDAQPASIVPPIAHLTDGPSGLVHYPGTGLPAEHEGAFFVCDFLGASGRSGVREFHLEPVGASYRMTATSMFAQGVLATDCDFGPDGNLYLVDWLEGWTGTGKGRIYRIENNDPRAAAERAALRQALASIAAADDDALVELLYHADMRVRLAAQQRLIERGAEARPRLVALAGQGAAPQLARIHALWAVTALAAGESAQLAELVPLTHDGDAEIRNQTARALGTARTSPTLDDAPPDAQERRTAIGEALVALLADESPRVRTSAAIAIGKLRYGPALAALVQFAAENADRDPVLRHAAAFGLAGTQSAESLVAAAATDAEPARLAIAVALGRLRSPLVARLLNDDSDRVVLEAARAIWDAPIEAAYPQLAAAMDSARTPSEPLLRRTLAACRAVGEPEHLASAVRFALRSNISPEAQALAWDAVGRWATASPRDPVHGSWRPLPPMPKERVLAVLAPMWPEIRRAPSDPTGIVVAAELGLPEAIGVLLGVVENERVPGALRARAVGALASADDAVVLQALDAALASPQVEVRLAARRLLVERFPARAVEALTSAAESASMPERQEALQILASIDAPAAHDAIARWLARVEQGDCPPELVLEVLEAAATSPDAAVVARQAAYKRKLAAEGPLAEFSMCLDGGDPLRGAEVFANNQTLACKRCHSVKPGLDQVGPSLSDVGARRSRAEILESIVRPNAKIVEGFQTTSMLLETGLAVSGILRRENDTHAVLVDPDGKEIVVELAEIEERSQGLSAMPEGLTQNMTPRHLRDLVAYLSTLKTPPTAATPAAGGHDASASAAEPPTQHGG